MSSVMIAALLIAANGLFVAMEFALLASLRSRVEESAETVRGRLALRSMGRLGVVLAGTQLGVTLCSLALGSVAEPALDRTLAGWFEHLGLPERAGHTGAVVLALAVVVFVHLVIGEMVPKSIALSRPESTLLALSVPASAFIWLLTPVIWVLNRLARLGAGLFGVEPADELRTAATSAELGLMLQESREEGLIDNEEHELLVAALGFLERATRDVMVDRQHIVSVPRSTTIVEAEQVIRASGHTRLFVTGRTVDDLLGFVHAKDLLALRGAARDRALPLQTLRPALVVSPDDGLGDVLVAMRRARRHVAVVNDAERRTVGMITMEDVLESIVGDIVDETDRSPSAHSG